MIVAIPFPTKTGDKSFSVSKTNLDSDEDGYGGHFIGVKTCENPGEDGRAAESSQSLSEEEITTTSILLLSIMTRTLCDGHVARGNINNAKKLSWDRRTCRSILLHNNYNADG